MRSQDVLERTIAMLEMDRGAARRFFLYISKRLDVLENVRFVLVLLTIVRRSLLAKAQEQESNSSIG